MRKKILFTCLFTMLLATSVFGQTLSKADATKIAKEALAMAMQQNVNVSVVIIGKDGKTLVSMSMPEAGLHTVPTAQKKAFTSMSFKITTTEFANRVKNVPELLQIDGVTSLSGGVPIAVNGVVVAAIGIGGAPSGLTDEKLAQDAIAKVIQ